MRKTKLKPGEMLYVDTEFGTVRIDAPRPGLNDIDHAVVNVDISALWEIDTIERKDNIGELFVRLKHL